MNRYGIPKEDNVELKQNIEIASSGSSIKYIPKYYSIEKDASEEIIGFISQYCSTIKCVYDRNIFINPVSFVNDSSLTFIGFSFNPIYTEIFGDIKYINSIEEICAFMGSEETDLLFQSIKRITEEEFYKI